PWPATRTGSYGVTSRIGRVLSVERDVKTLEATIEVLIAGKDPTAQRRFGPIARLVDDHETVEERHDAASRTLYCYADAWGRGAGAKDVAAFAEPPWGVAGGQAQAAVWQSWDGVEFERTATFQVE